MDRMQIQEMTENELKQTCTADLTHDTQRELKNKQTQNIIHKIQYLLNKVNPIHEVY